MRCPLLLAPSPPILLYLLLVLPLPLTFAAPLAAATSLESRANTSAVSWDSHSVLIHGERVAIYSAEIHGFRYPSPASWVEVMQKLKAAGFNTVSTYFFWGLIEAKRGVFHWDGFPDPQSFFDAAREAGMHVIARPGPYINAEVSSGGFPGWMQRVEGSARNSIANYTDAWMPYITQIFEIIARNQFDQGGPVIAVQLENEYDKATGGEDFTYEEQLKEAAQQAGITIPTTHNGALSSGFGNYFVKNVDIWGYDEYPVSGTVCPTGSDTWANTAINQLQWNMHLESTYNPTEPMAVFEFEGGIKQGWGDHGYCGNLAGVEFQRMFYKNKFSMATTIFSLYMGWGGTNWGGIGSPDVYTSYDYGAMIAEDRTLREKYSEAKLQGHFLMSSPAYLTAIPQNIGNNTDAFVASTTSSLTVTFGLDVVGHQAKFFFVRHTAASSTEDTAYSLTLPTSLGNLTIPQLGGNLSLFGRDTKIHVVDYRVGQYTILYSSAEVMTSLVIDGTTVVVLYGDNGQTHETAVKTCRKQTVSVFGDDTASVTSRSGSGSLIIQYLTTGMTVVQIGQNLLLYLLDRETAYKTWPVLSSNVLLNGGYLIRDATVKGNLLTMQGDLNDTTTLEIVAPKSISQITFNGRVVQSRATSYGARVVTIQPQIQQVNLPDLKSLTWKYSDSLPEIDPSYDDSAWTSADIAQTFNPNTPKTPVSLYSGDYGYHTGSILWRGHFTASGGESAITLNVYGGSGFGYSVWNKGTFLGSWAGKGGTANHTDTFAFDSAWPAGDTQVITIVQDHFGYDMSWTANTQLFKAPRGIYSYGFASANESEVVPAEFSWKVQGNLGGEDYVDLIRGPFNEGGLYAERHGWHLPGFPDDGWNSSSPFNGLSTAGIGFYRTTFALDIPSDGDYPISLNLPSIGSERICRVMIFINGYQFGRYVSAVGPQAKFPIPPAILNRSGENTLALSLWAMTANGAALDFLALEVDAAVEYGGPDLGTEKAPGYDPVVRRGAP